MGFVFKIVICCQIYLTNKLKFRFTILSLITFCYIAAFFAFDNWKLTMNNGDSSGYYMHLVSSIVNQDVGDYNQTIDDYLSNYPKAKDPREDKFGIRKTDKGKAYIKYTLGVAVMELPAMIIAHSIAMVSDKHKADGWSLPYTLVINFSKIIYIILGFFFLTKVLQSYFDNVIVGFTILSIAFATNLFYHGIFLSLAHSFLFFDFCLLIYLSKHFYENPSKKKALGIGLLVGLITLTRVPEVIGLLIPLLWGVTNIESAKSRFNFLKNNYAYLLIAGLGLILVFSPQIFYWHYVSGQFFFNPYQGEDFNFLKPQIFKGWFNFRNGWLIYTPIMFFSLIGLFFLKKKAPEALIPTIVFTLLIAWIHYSYYVWNYYPGMGSRPMIECYPVLAFALAAFFNQLFKREKLKWLAPFIFLFFTALNIFQTWQMKQGIIYTQNGNAAFYMETFCNTQSSLTALQCYDANRAQPKISELEFIDTLLFNDFEKAGTQFPNRNIKYSGDQSVSNNIAHILAETTIDISSTKLEAYDWVYVGIKAYRKLEDQVWKRETLEELFCEIIDENGKRVKSSKIKIAAHLGNKKFSIFHTGTPDLWDEAGFYFRISNKLKDGWQLKIFVRNLNQHKLYLDDLVLLHYKEK